MKIIKRNAKPANLKCIYPLPDHYPCPLDYKR